jgi:hypothetical protein
MVVMTAGYAECLGCGAVCVGACTREWLLEHAPHDEPAPQARC